MCPWNKPTIGYWRPRGVLPHWTLSPQLLWSQAPCLLPQPKPLLPPEIHGALPPGEEGMGDPQGGQLWAKPGARRCDILMPSLSHPHAGGPGCGHQGWEEHTLNYRVEAEITTYFSRNKVSTPNRHRCNKWVGRLSARTRVEKSKTQKMSVMWSQFCK